MRRIQMLNKALIPTIGWNLLEGSKDRVKFFLAKYLRNKNSTFFLSQLDLPSGSTLWNHLIRLRNVLKLGARKRIGNGINMDFWKDPWIENATLYAYEDLNPLKCSL